MLPLHDVFARTDRCGRQLLAKTVTFGAVLENSVPAVPSAHVAGTEESFVAYANQLGTGTAGPVQVICCEPSGSPVLSRAEESCPELNPFAKTPMPPRSTARGARKDPKNAEISGFEPRVCWKPMRGLIVIGDGTWSFLKPKTRST